MCTSTVPEVITYSRSSGPPSSKMLSPASKLAGSSSSSSSARSSASRCPKNGTPLKLGVSCILRLLQTAQSVMSLSRKASRSVSPLRSSSRIASTTSSSRRVSLLARVRAMRYESL